jgi:nifR3 family TIM-barrel protein
VLLKSGYSSFVYLSTLDKHARIGPMNLGFWAKLKKPIMVLAPMADVTDAAFRRLIAKYGKPDVMWTEFVSADGLCHPEGRKKLLIDLSYSEAERPIVAQLFSSKPEKMREAGKLVRELGFDGLDINMGCPDRSVEKQGCGAALIKNPKLAREIIRAAKEGAGDLPVSVKTRIGYNKNELETWLPELLAEEPAVITIHARTRKEMSDVPARWEHIKEAVAMRDRLGSKTLIFGNGDVLDFADARKKVQETGCDGVMLGNPFLFNNKVSIFEMPVPNRLKIMLEHTELFEKLFTGIKNFAIMKKHYKAYVNGFDGAKELRVELMEAENVEEVRGIVERYLKV